MMNAPVYIDTHAHLFFKEYREDIEAVLERALAAGVRAVVIPGTDLETSREAVALAHRFPMLYAAVGVHPHDARKADPATMKEIEALSMERKVVAIGEIGLDYHYDYSPRDIQQKVFRDHIALAAERDLPIIIHSRESEEDVLRIVREGTETHASWAMDADGARRGVFHCFPGDGTMADEVIRLGFYISFPGPVTFPDRPNKPNTMAAVVTQARLGRLLLETDSPYLTPVPFRGKRNEPSYVPQIAQRVAELAGSTLAEIAGQSTQNAQRLFRIQEL